MKPSGLGFGTGDYIRHVKRRAPLLVKSIYVDCWRDGQPIYSVDVRDSGSGGYIRRGYVMRGDAKKYKRFPKLWGFILFHLYVLFLPH